jgi:ion channel-forming bestrophin family protein
MNRSWFRYAFQFRGSVVPAVTPRTLISGLFALLVSWLHSRGLLVNMGKLDVLASVVPSVVLGLMLVFRTNTAYERFWEGRKLWGGIVNTIRNLARQIWINVEERTAGDRYEKKAVLELLIAFAIATKQHLRQEAIAEIEPLLSLDRYSTLKTTNNPPLEIVVWVQDYLQEQSQMGKLHVYQLSKMQDSLNLLVDNLGGCERVLKTPIPLAYAIHLKQLLLIYTFTLPFQFIEKLGWFTPLIIILVSFTLFGIEQIGIEIENPFGHDDNDLPLDGICQTIKNNIADLMLVEPLSARQPDR